MNDFISRQAAIDGLYEMASDMDHLCTVSDYVSFLESLPSAQPDADLVAVIRCKDCRWGKEVCGNIECFADTNVPPEYHGYEWFCPNGERRTDE